MDQSQLNDHPGQALLLLYFAQELPSGQSREIASHLGHCWTCVATAERLKQGIQIFIESRDSLASSQFEVPSPSARALRERMESRTRERGTVSRCWHALAATLHLPFSRPLQIAALFSVSLCAFLLFITRPPNLNAAEVLRRASASVKAENSSRSRWVHRKIRIRSGSKVVDWESYRGAGEVSARRTAESAEWTRILRGPISWDDPLSISDFSEWRDRHHPVHDSIAESNDRITLTTSGQRDEGIHSSSLTVRRADWHPIAKSITLDGRQLVEVTELVWEVREVTSLRANHSLATGERPLAPAPSRKQAPVAPVSDTFDRELAEIRVRDALFSLRVGLTGEEPGFIITSEPEALIVEVATQSAAREASIRTALSQIAGVRANVLGPGALRDAASRETVPASRPPGVVADHHWSQPLLWDVLVTKRGSAQAAAEYAGKVLTSAGKVRALVAQAHGLSARYPPEVCRTLSDDAQSQLDGLVGKVMRSLAHSSDQYTELLTAGFDRAATALPPFSDLSWQRRADLLFRLVSERDPLLANLFAVTDADKDRALTPEQALRDYTTLNERIAELAADKTR